MIMQLNSKMSQTNQLFLTKTNIFIIFWLMSVALAENLERNCGEFDLERKTESLARITGGVNAPHMAPWQVKLTIKFRKIRADKPTDNSEDEENNSEAHFLKDSSCGGSILDEWNILTAQHCVEEEKNFKLVSIKVWAGQYLFKNNFPVKNKEKARRRDEEFKHEYLEFDAIKNVNVINKDGYNSQTLVNDVTLLHLPNPLNLSKSKDDKYVYPICLPTKDNKNLVNESDCFVFGWGRLCEHGKIKPEAMQMAQVEILEDDDWRCNVNKKLQLCAAGDLTTGAPDPCGGDSGGGLVCRLERSTKNFVLMGIVSGATDNCGSKNVPTLYARVNAFSTWIEENKKKVEKQKEKEDEDTGEDDDFEYQRRQRMIQRARKAKEEREQKEKEREKEEMRQQIRREERQRLQTTDQPDHRDDEKEKRKNDNLQDEKRFKRIQRARQARQEREQQEREREKEELKQQIRREERQRLRTTEQPDYRDDEEEEPPKRRPRRKRPSNSANSIIINNNNNNILAQSQDGENKTIIEN